MRYNRPFIALFIFATLLGLATFANAQITNMATVAKIGDPSPTGGTFASVNQPSINSKNEVAFLASAPDSGSPSTIIFVKSNILSANSELRPLASINTPAPVRGRFGTFTYPKINDSGEVAFSSILIGGETGGGIFIISADGQVRKVVLDGEPTPIGGSFESVSVTSDFTFNNRGDLVFDATIQNGSSQNAIFLASGGQIIKVAADGQPAPGGGTISLHDFEVIPTVNNNGDVLFSAPTLESPNAFNIYLFSGGTLRRVIGASDPTPDGKKFDSVLAMGRFLNDQRKIAFMGLVSGKPAIYFTSADDATITKLVGLGDNAPDGGTFKFLGLSLTPANSGFNNSGQLVFRASTTKTDDGLFFYDGSALRKIVGKSEPTPLGGIFPIDAAFNSAFLGPMLSDSGFVVFETTISGGVTEKALILWSPQELNLPKILSAKYANKRLSITVNSVDPSAKIEVNGRLIDQKVDLVGTDQLKVKGSRKALNLKKGSGTNQVVVIINGLRSIPFKF